MQKNIKIVPFSELFEWSKKSSIKSGEGKREGNYKFYVCSDTDIKRLDTYLENGEALIFGTGGKPSCHFADEPFAYSTDCAVATPKSNSVYTKFYYYYFRQNNLSLLQSTFTGSGLQHTSKKKIEKILVPILEIAEQKRIVEKIEELLSQLDSGVETLKKTKAQLEVYRQAVLKSAFDFYTDMVEISSIVEDIRIGPFGTALHKDDYIDNGVPVINPQHIKKNAIQPSPKITVSKEKAEELSSYRLKANDVIMGRRGEMGRTAAVNERESGWICGTGSIRFRLKEEFDAEFYAQILSSPSVVHYLEENATGTTMKNLNEEIVKHIPVPQITRQKQTKINNTLESSLSVCDSIERTVDIALKQSEAMRQSILKKAFEGSL